MGQSTVVKENEFINPDFDEVDYLLDKILKIVEKNIFIRLNINAFMTLNLQI